MTSRPSSMHRYALAGLLLAGLLSAGCQRESQEDPLVLTGRIFVFNYRYAYAHYLITLNRSERIPAGSRILATFEDPRGGDALTLEQPIFPHQNRVALESQPILCVRKDRPYKVAITLKGPDGALLQRLETAVVSDVDQSILPAKPLVVGAGYTPNPEVFKTPDGPPDLTETIDCPT